MVTVDRAVIAKYVKDGKHFEILVDPEIAYQLKEKKSVSVQKMLAVNEVFTDSKKGLRASPSDIAKAFGTSDIEKIAEIIIHKGELQLTTDLRRKKTEERRKQIAALISRYSYDPKTGTPHPQERILNAMAQTHINIDPFKPAEQQIDETIDKIRELLPISMDEIVLAVDVPAQHSSRAYGLMKEFGTIKSDKWHSDGSLSVTVSVPAGIKVKLYSALNSATAGNIKIDEIKNK